jgi:hypothetical protein
MQDVSAPVHSKSFSRHTGEQARCTVAPAVDGWWGVYFSCGPEISVRYFEKRRLAMRYAALTADALLRQGWGREKSGFVLLTV